MMDTTYIFLQHYWWFLVSLLGAFLVFLLFVQGGNSLIFTLGRTEEERSLIINSTGRKWEFTFTTLVTFGGAFFASFPLFYSTSFGGAYWLWMLILFTFVLQAVSYEFQSKIGNFLGKRTYQYFLVINGIFGPILLGMAVSTLFYGANFQIDKGNLTSVSMPVISSWTNSWHGLDAFAQPWNLVLGLAVFFLARILGCLYFIRNICHNELMARCRKQVLSDSIPFVLFFVSYLVAVLTKVGYSVDPESGLITLVGYKYLDNLLDMPLLLILLLIGILCVLAGIVRTLMHPHFRNGIWYSGTGTVITVLCLLLTVGYNNTAYYPSLADAQCSLTLANSCSSLFTLKTMAYASLLIPFVLAYIIYAWRAINKRRLTIDELKNDHHSY